MRSIFHCNKKDTPTHHIMFWLQRDYLLDGFSSKKMKIDFFYFFLKAQDLCHIRKAGDFYMKVIIFRFLGAPAIRLALNPSCLCFSCS